MIEIVSMNFISYQKLVKMVKDVYYSKGLSYELALKWGLIGFVYVRTTKLPNFHGMN